MKDLLLEYQEIFQDIDTLPPHRGEFDHPIDLEDESKPPWKPIYPMTLEELEFLKKEINRLLELGFIQRSISPFGAPLFLVIEKTGKIRMVFDY